MATPTATSTTSDGPVLSVITKRLRALRKKLTRITQMEQSLAQGKTLNNEQLDVLHSKPAVLTLIDELEKLRAPLCSALDEELSLALANTHEPDRKYEVGVEQPQPQPLDGGNDEDNNNSKNNDSNLVKDLVNLMYFGSLFDVKPPSEFTSLMLTRTHERGCCLTYDYVTDDVTDLLGERDLDLISALQGLMIARPVDSTLSHQNALEMCFEHAKLWLANADQPIDDQSNVTYAALREKLNKIMSSDYFTAMPQMKGPGEVAAAAAAGNFGLFQAPTQEPMASVEMPIQVEGSHEQYQETAENAENAANYEEYETTGHQPGNAEEFHKDELEPENPPEVVSVQTDQEQSQNAEGEHDYRNADFKDQQYIHRRGQRGGRGGGRRGYPNGRGGRGTGRGNGPYQNDRNQYYDNYYPRNNYYNRRGGRGGGGGGGYYNNSSGAHGSNSQENIEVAS